MAAQIPMQKPRNFINWIYVALGAILALGIVYVLVFGQISLNSSAPNRTPLSEAGIGFIQSTLQSSATNPLLAIIALGAALLVGALHALTPGHNKTLTGSYLVGSRARLRDAVLLGVTTALSHTASALVIGILAVSTIGQLVSTQYFQWVGIPSGLLTIALGIYLLWKNTRGVGHGHATEHDHNHDHPHPHGQPHDHYHPEYDTVTLGGLFVMGLMHGIVPTIDALAIILVALSVSQIALGVGLVVAYSVGIAGVLIAVGALFLRAQRVMVDNQRFEWFADRATLIAAMVVIVFGLSLFLRTLLAVGLHD
ncbi:MAG: sulfite exporter TauE/SafE family protein [Anaerolineae bacterium]|nr:sulfite exporter TauE/SafE family protein [Anaerolineae bacterium]